MTERVNTGGLTEIIYPKGFKSSKNPKRGFRIERAYRVIKRRKIREGIIGRLFIGIISSIIGMILIFRGGANWRLLSIILLSLGLFMILISGIRMIYLKRNKIWRTQEDLDYERDHEEDSE